MSHFDEDPDHLARCVKSCAKIATDLVAVDGPYGTYPHQGRAQSPLAARLAVKDAARDAGVQLYTHAPRKPWEGGEVEKRAAMFHLARQCGATPDDWLLVIDADCVIAEVHEDTRHLLKETTADVAEIRLHNVRPDDHVMSTAMFRAMFRALPGLTVKWMHPMYVVPEDSGWRYLWHTPACRLSQEPSLNLYEHVTMHHRRLDRSGDRDAAARKYYSERGRLKLEKAPHW